MFKTETGRKPLSSLTTLLLSAVILLLGLLVWSYQENRGLESALTRAERQIAELEKQGLPLPENPQPKTRVLSTEKPEPVSSTLSLERLALPGPPATMADTPAPEIKEDTRPADEGALADLPDPGKAPDELALARQAFATLDYDEALKNYASVTPESEDYLPARLGVANALFYSHQYEEAAREYAELAVLAPDSVDALIGLANAHQRLGQHAQQAAAYDKVIKLQPKKWLHYNSRASAHLMNNDHVRAERDFRQAAQLAKANSKDQATALENVGFIHLREKEWQQAFELANRVNEIDRKHSWNWLLRGIAAAKLERYVDAYVSYDEWFKTKLATDPYLVKQLLPDSLHEYVDVSERALTRVVDPPLISGDLCVNKYQCKSLQCRPGPPSNHLNYCVAEDKDCAAPNSNGYLLGETLLAEGVKVRCYQPQAANARWTPQQSRIK